MATRSHNEKTENGVTFMSTSPEPMEQTDRVSEESHNSRNGAVDSDPQSRKVLRPPPFSRRLTRSLFLRPASSRGPAPGYLESLKSAATYSWINLLLVFNPIAWALHYTHQTDGVRILSRKNFNANFLPPQAVFAMALSGVIPLAGMLGHGTETIALYTGDALGGLINASLGNATEFIIAILLLVKCEIRVVQASLLVSISPHC